MRLFRHLLDLLLQDARRQVGELQPFAGNGGGVIANALQLVDQPQNR